MSDSNKYSALKGCKLYIREDQDKWLDENFASRERSRAVQEALDLFQKHVEANRERLSVTRINVEELANV